MKVYKMFTSQYPKPIEEEMNRLSKKGYEVFSWKMNDNAICMIMAKEVEEEKQPMLYRDPETTAKKLDQIKEALNIHCKTSSLKDNPFE